MSKRNDPVDHDILPAFSKMVETAIPKGMRPNRFSRKVVNNEHSKKALTADDVIKLLEDLHKTKPENILRLRGRILSGQLQKLVDYLDYLDFSGCDLREAYVGTLPEMDNFTYSAKTIFHDALSPHLVDLAENKHGIRMRLEPPARDSLSM